MKNTAHKELIDNNLATKRDLKELKKDLIIAMGKMATAIIVILGVLLPIVFKLLGLHF